MGLAYLNQSIVAGLEMSGEIPYNKGRQERIHDARGTNAHFPDRGPHFPGRAHHRQGAAEIQGRSVSDFVVAAAQEAAHRTIEETQIIRLSVEDQEAFAEAILNPPPLMSAMERAIERYRRETTPSR